jgi:hypothetical protein
MTIASALAVTAPSIPGRPGVGVSRELPALPDPVRLSDQLRKPEGEHVDGPIVEAAALGQQLGTPGAHE